MPKRALLIAIILLAAACSKNDSQDAFRNAVIEHLSSRPGLDMSKMDVTIDKSTVNGDHATVAVTFHVKGGATNQGMSMSYELVRSDGAWKVQGLPTGHGADSGAAAPMSPHGGGAPPMAGGAGEKAGSSEGFHPDTSGGAGALPSGHPPVKQ